MGWLLHCTFRGLLSVHSRYGLHARQVTHVTLYTGGSDGFVTSTAAPIATEWNEPVLGRDFHPQRTSAFHGAQHSSIRAKRKRVFQREVALRLLGAESVAACSYRPAATDGLA